MTIDCVCPAHNEALTVGVVVGVLRASGVFRQIIVVDDGSKDETARVAMAAGANVLRLTPNGGKSAAMFAGIQAAEEMADDEPADAFSFFDADLVGLTPNTIHRLHAAFMSPERPDHVVGLQDHGIMNIAQVLMPLISGQRFLRRWIVEELPNSCWESSYGIETAINFICDKNGGKTCLVPMKGVTGKLKQEKVGFVKGWMGHFKMARQMSETRKALETTGGLACRLPKK